MKKQTLIASMLFCALAMTAQTTETIHMQKGEKWWGAATDLGTRMPYGEGPTLNIDLRTQNFNNQTSPALYSNRGRGVWCGGPFRMTADSSDISLQTVRGGIEVETYGKTLRDAYLGVMRKHFPPTGNIPPELFFTRPVYNTWIELLYDQNQADIIKYAEDIVAHGFPTGIIMIDDNWQRDYGDWEFRAERFAAPKAMVDRLHGMGFKVMLWVCPFVSPDSKKGRDLAAKGYFVKRKGSRDPALVSWWNGYSYAYDLSNPEAREYLKSEFTGLQRRYGIDGFKFDAGDPERYLSEDVDVADGKSFDVEQSRLWAQLGSEFAYNEMRACWREGGAALVQRLGDKEYSWRGVAQLVPDMIAAGLLGYAYACPDMIGGGQYGSFYGVDPAKFNQQLMVRSCQIHSMMPIMQFSVAPWRVLDNEHLELCRRYAVWHEQLGGYLLGEARRSAKTGEPIVRAMDYSFPGEGLEGVTDQYMLGDRYLVAPVSNGGARRTVRLPKGKWRDDTGKTWRGGRTISISVPTERLPWFEKI